MDTFERLLNQAVIHADPPAGKRSDPPDEEQHIISTLTDLFFRRLFPLGSTYSLTTFSGSKNSTTRWSSLEGHSSGLWRPHLATLIPSYRSSFSSSSPRRRTPTPFPPILRLANQVVQFSWFSIPCGTERLLSLQSVLQEVSNKHGRRHAGHS